MNDVQKIADAVNKRKASTGLITTLREMAKQIDRRIPDVNYGGCCVVAAEIADKLQHIVPTRIRVAGYFGANGCNVDVAHQKVGNSANGYDWHENGIYFGHVIVEFDYRGRTYHLDSSGVHKAGRCEPSFGYELYDGNLPLEAAKALADEWSNWNSRFNRKYIPLIKSIVWMHAQPR